MLTLAGDYGITQIVDGNWRVRAAAAATAARAKPAATRALTQPPAARHTLLGAGAATCRSPSTS